MQILHAISLPKKKAKHLINVTCQGLQNTILFLANSEFSLSLFMFSKLSTTLQFSIVLSQTSHLWKQLFTNPTILPPILSSPLTSLLGERTTRLYTVIKKQQLWIYTVVQTFCVLLSVPFPVVSNSQFAPWLLLSTEVTFF